MHSNEVIDAFCVDCNDITKHEVVGQDNATCRCLVCDHAQVLA